MDRALNGVEELVYFYGELAGTRVVHNDRLLMFLLRNRAPDRFARLATEACDRCSSPRMACVVLALPCKICPIDPSAAMAINLHHHMLGPNT